MNKESVNRIVREILPGLPGEGPAPRHFHVGHPTPWKEGVVVRFWTADGAAWVGNFQGRQDWSKKVVLWPESDSVIVLAMDDFYLVNSSNPEEYVTLDSQCLVDDVMLDGERKTLFIRCSSTYNGMRTGDSRRSRRAHDWKMM